MIGNILEILLPLLALLLFVIPKRAVSYYSFFIIFLGSVRAVLGILNSLFSFELPYGYNFTPLASVFAISVVIVVLSASAYSCGYIRVFLSKKSRINFAVHFLSFVLLFYSMLGVLSAGTKMNFLFSWELMSLSSFVLILWDANESRKVFHAALGYLILMHTGLFFLIFGFFLLPNNQELMGYGAMNIFVWLLFFIGFGIKVGLFPLHSWLPEAHRVAPSHVTSLMSAAMLYIGIYGIFKATLATSDLFSAGIILFVCGAVTALYGVYKSASELNLKQLLAYSSIDNMGIILVSIGIGAIGKASGSFVLAFCGYCGALIHMLCHSSFKSLLYINAGSVQQAAGTLNLDILGGLFKKMPVTNFLFLIASVSAMAIPPFSGFAGEFVVLGGIFSAFAKNENVLLSLVSLILFSLIGGTTLLAMVKAYSKTMLSETRGKLTRAVHEVNSWMKAGAFFSFLFVICGGILFPLLVFSKSEITIAVSDVAGEIAISELICKVFALGYLIILIALILFLLKKYVLLKGRTRVEPTWGCGAENLSSLTHYSASSFSSELVKEIQPSSSIEAIQEEGLFAHHKVVVKVSEGNISGKITLKLVGMMHRWTTRLAHVQTGKVNHYVLHVLLFILLIGILSLFVL